MTEFIKPTGPRGDVEEGETDEEMHHSEFFCGRCGARLDGSWRSEAEHNRHSLEDCIFTIATELHNQRRKT